MPLGIRPTLGQGALWGQVLQRSMEQFVDSTEYILTTDMDSFWGHREVSELVALAMAFQCDALAPLQVKREDGRPMFTLPGTLEKPPAGGATELPMSWFAEPVQEVDSAHFGCTLISTMASTETAGPTPTSSSGSNSSVAATASTSRLACLSGMGSGWRSGRAKTCKPRCSSTWATTTPTGVRKLHGA
jgi:hypothetical protein